MAEKNNNDQRLKAFEELSEAMQSMDVKIRAKEEESCEISKQIEELERILRKSVTEQDLLNEDTALQQLEEEERKLLEELELIQKAPRHDDQRETESTDDDVDVDGAEEITTEFKHELERTMSSDENWNYPSVSNHMN